MNPSGAAFSMAISLTFDSLATRSANDFFDPIRDGGLVQSLCAFAGW